MKESKQSKAKSISRIAFYSGAAILCLSAMSYADNGRLVRWVLAIAGFVIGVGAIRALYRFSDAEDGGQLASERLVVALAVGVISVVLVAVNLERIATPTAPSMNTEGVSVTRISPAAVEAGDLKSPLNKPEKKTEVSDIETAAKPATQTPNGPQMPPRLAQKVDDMLIEADKAVKAGNPKDAEPLLLQVLDMMDTHAPRDLPQRGQVVGTLARVRFSVEKRGEGIDVIDQHIARLEEIETTDPTIIASFHELAGTLLGNSGAFAESIDRFRQVYDIQTRIRAAPKEMASTHAKLAISHAKLDDKSAAKQELDRARELLRTAKPEDTEAQRRLMEIAKEYDL
jgi:hypothetical protein